MVDAHIEKTPATTFFESVVQEHILKTFLKCLLICHSPYSGVKETSIIIVPQILSFFITKEKTTVYKCQIDF